MAQVRDEFSHQRCGVLAAVVARATPGFDPEVMTAGLEDALAPLGMWQRADLIVDRLLAQLPDDLGELEPIVGRMLRDDDLDGWIVVPVAEVVTRVGLDHPERALALLAALTPRFSAEFAIRPLLETHPEVAYPVLRGWVEDPDEHVRRLVSEGTRPRLPWGRRLRAAIQDPTPGLELIDHLVDDPSEYVRRSVANHLNDVSRDHPGLALDRARSWSGRSDVADAVVRHAVRTLVKVGDPAALALVGVEADAPVRVERFEVTPRRIEVGEVVTLEIALVLDASAPAPVEVLVDYRIAHMGARGPRAPKVFKLTRRRMTPGKVITIVRDHRIAEVSVRRIHPGPHAIDVQVNGRVLAGAVVEVG